MAETTKERLNKQFAQLESERQSFEPHWRELSDYINPRGSRFLTSEVNRNDRRNTRIIDSTGTMAARTLASGMMSGITSPARPWFRLATPDPEMMDYGPVKLWLEAVQNRMNDMFNKSNLYQSLPQLYGSLGTYSTGAMAVLEDDEDIIRTMPFPIGSYYLANSPRGSVDTCFRKFSMTVRQLVQEFGLNNVSESVKSMWESGTYEKWIEVMHSVYPNIDRDTSKLDSKNKPFKSVYYEVGGDNDKLLRESGFDEFPIMAPRWEVNGEDVYGSSCPGTSAPNFSPVDIDAALAANAAHHAEIDIAPGVPINVLSRNSHIQALRKAMSDASQGRPVDVASIVESASFSEIPGRKNLLSQAVNDALSSVDDGVTSRAIENRLLEEQAAQLLPRGDRQVYQSEIANSQRIIDNLTEQRAQILAEEPTGSGKALSRARSDKQARLRDIDQRIRQAQERLEFSRNALAPHEPGGQFFEARAELARRQQAESELNAQAVSFYKTAEVRTPDEVAPFEPGKILQQTEQKMMADPAGDIDLRIAEDSLLESPDMIITVLDDDGNPQSRSAREVLDEANRESEQAIQDSSLFDVAVACFLRG